MEFFIIPLSFNFADYFFVPAGKYFNYKINLFFVFCHFARLSLNNWRRSSISRIWIFRCDWTMYVRYNKICFGYIPILSSKFDIVLHFNCGDKNWDINSYICSFKAWLSIKFDWNLYLREVRIYLRETVCATL